MVTTIALASAAAYGALAGLMMNTSNIRSAMIFKVIPFCIAMICAFALLLHLGVFTMPA